VQDAGMAAEDASVDMDDVAGFRAPGRSLSITSL